MDDVERLWVFGYGSLVWKPGFQPGKTATGFVKGFSRKFWQGNETHRGRPGAPGRVATLVEEEVGITHGVALQLTGEAALDYLNNREMTLGGYIQKMTTFRPAEDDMQSFDVLVFVATPESKHWLGDEPEEKIAKQVVRSSGPSGHNVEYVLKLAMWLRQTFPDVVDKHLYELEKHVMIEIKVNKLPLHLLMGEQDEEAWQVSTTPTPPPTMPATSRSYSSTCAPQALRCVKR